MGFFFNIFYYYEDKENRSLYQGLRYVEIYYLEVPLHKDVNIQIPSLDRTDTNLGQSKRTVKLIVTQLLLFEFLSVS